MTNDFLHVPFEKPLSKDFIKVTFDLKINSLPKTAEKDDSFIFDNEFFVLNLGETGKFDSTYIYQSKLVIFKDSDYIKFGGYSPDWRRETDLLRDRDGNYRFDPFKDYHIELIFSRYRCYININNGEIVGNYGNARLEVEDIRFYQKEESLVSINNLEVIEYDKRDFKIDDILRSMIDKGIVTNYLNYHIDDYGVYFDRLNIIQNVKCLTRNSGQYNTNVIFDMYTNSRRIGIEYTIQDSEVRDYECGLSFLLNRKEIRCEIRKVNKGETYYDEVVLDDSTNKENRITICLPTSFSIAIKKVVIDEGSKYEPVEKNKTAIFLGDSITEGSECFNPSKTYFNMVSLAYNLKSIDQAISGATFNDHNLLGDYDIKPDYIFIANGTNSFCMGVSDKDKTLNEMERNMTLVIDSCHKYFENATIIALLPIWRSDEEGKVFSLEDTAIRMKEVYSRYKDIKVINCHEYIPYDAKYFSNPELALHPNSIGHEIYGNALIKDLKNVIGDVPVIDDEKNAKLALRK